jgi:hypothetical protein
MLERQHFVSVNGKCNSQHMYVESMAKLHSLSGWESIVGWESVVGLSDTDLQKRDMTDDPW